MVVASLDPVSTEKVQELAVPLVDLSSRRDLVKEVIVGACKDFGFFKVINHGIPEGVIQGMETKARDFFAMPAQEKLRAGPPNPLGYGIRNIGSHGDTGELEYLLLHTGHEFLSQKTRNFCSKDPGGFSHSVAEYVASVRELACELLDMLGEGMGLRDSTAFSRLLRDSESDSLLRLNHYPPCCTDANKNKDSNSHRVGFGEHTDPQVLTMLRSNDVPGLQFKVFTSTGAVWVPVPAEPDAFYVVVGDTLQAMTNGRFKSVRHRAMTNYYTSRLSMAFFGAASLDSRISPVPEMIMQEEPRLYKSFMWGDYKKAMYTLRLGYNRLELYREDVEEEDTDQKIQSLTAGIGI